MSADIPALFPEGSLQDPPAALPAIWENWDDFSGKFDRCHERVLSLKQTLQGDDREKVRAGFRELATTCKGCHDDYKAD